MSAILVRRRRRRTVGISLMLLAGATGVALAHARLVRSTPAANGHVERPPVELRLEFSEAVTARTSRIDLVAPDSQRVQLTVRGDSTNSHVLIAGVPPLASAGEYRVDWRLVGADGHAISGRYVYTVDSIPVVLPADTNRAVVSTAPEGMHDPPTDSLTQRIIRFASMLSMVVIIGAIAFALLVLPATTRAGGEGLVDFRARIEHRLRSFAILGAWSLVVLAMVRLVSHGTVLSGSLRTLGVRDLTDLITSTTFGRGWLLQVAAAIALLGGLRAKAPYWRGLVGVVAALAISAPFMGHPAAVTDARFAAMTLDAVHVLAAGTWTGSILMLALTAMPEVATVPVAGRIDAVRRLLRAFSPLALWCAATVVVTGAIGGWLQVRSLDQVLGSDYGTMLIRKVVVVLVVAAVGAYHWRVAQPAVASERPVARMRISLAIDATLVLLVLVVTAVLTGTTPPIR